MFLKRLRRIFNTLVFRLTLWYAAIFTVCSLLAFWVFYLQITSIVRERTDDELREEVEELSSRLASAGLEGVKLAFMLEAEDEGEDKIFYRLVTADGKELASSDPSSWTDLGVDRLAIQRAANGAGPVLETLSLRAREHKVRVLYGLIPPGTILQIGMSLEDDDEFVAEFREIFGTTVAAVMVFAALLGWFMAKRAMGGVEEVTRTAREISAGDMQQRVPVTGAADEIERLATTFNSMLDRIQTLIIEMREMNDNIAHDLRSPITKIRGIAEMTLTSGKSIDEYESATANTIEQCDRLLEMINTMLYISEAAAGARNVTMEEVDMARVVRDACELFQPMADDKGLNLFVRIDGELRVRGDLHGLQRMVANIIDNAINYTSSPGDVTVSVNGDEKVGVISVEDTGMGISQKDLPDIFKRFYRCDQSRSQPGTGLGLSLVQAIAHSHGGRIAVTSTLNVGSTFTVSLPRVA